MEEWPGPPCSYKPFTRLTSKQDDYNGQHQQARCDVYHNPSAISSIIMGKHMMQQNAFCSNNDRPDV